MTEQDIKLFADKIRDAESIVIFAHKNPDADALCSVLAMMQLIEINFGKTALCIYDGNIPNNLEYVPLRHRIKFFGHQDLSGPFDLAIALDYGTTRNIGGPMPVIENSKFVVEIDHHQNDDKIGTLCLDDETASSVGEILFQIIETLNWEYDEKIADLIALSILTDTGFFKFARRGVPLSIMAKLVDGGVSIGRLIQIMNNKPRKTVQTEAQCAASAQFYYHNRLALAIIDKKMYRNLDGRGELVLNLLGQIEGVEYIVLLKEQKSDQIGVSLRSRTKPVDEIAAALGGGGHMYASGAVVRDTLENVRSRVLELFRGA